MPPPSRSLLKKLNTLTSTVDTSNATFALVSGVRNDLIPYALRQVHWWVNSGFVELAPVQRVPKSILISRLTPASKVVETNLVSCGSLATLGASILRQLGFAVALVHGVYHGGPHAWIAVWDGERWTTIDFSDRPLIGRPDLPDHIVIRVCADWQDMIEDLKALDRGYSHSGSHATPSGLNSGAGPIRRSSTYAGRRRDEDASGNLVQWCKV